MTITATAPDAVIMPLKDEWLDKALKLNEMGSRFFTPYSSMYIRNQKDAVFGRLDGMVVGVLFYHLWGTLKRKNFCVGIISVEPSYRGKGVGKAMLDCAYALALESGSRAMRVEVKDNNAHSLALMKKSGFHKRRNEHGVVILTRVL
ncbi:GNAT family N-acetyltransferase [Agrobacterium salinitolerans]|uniref:GNAT family N-acetyltransferase n=1 Tax=Agrobacterium salinitolerans TaxID=1183413 RepID=UPI000DD2ECAF|nr:GNAT family N-acetyltransferase [Agrobacterium salinitolerans]MCZ7975027.1 GNAT family N-acetyltransferase [Agrobacterium salinitolerans]